MTQVRIAWFGCLILYLIAWLLEILTDLCKNPAASPLNITFAVLSCLIQHQNWLDKSQYTNDCFLFYPICFSLKVFFVIHFHNPEQLAKLGKIQDPDPMLSCDLMDGRDAFLTLAREKHWEFSSLRRAKFSTMAMLVELHNQGTERFVYTCNICKRHVETRYHCTECEVRIYTAYLFFLFHVVG